MESTEQGKLSTEEKIERVLDCVCRTAGNPELPVRTAFELAQTLQRFFVHLDRMEEPDV